MAWRLSSIGRCSAPTSYIISFPARRFLTEQFGAGSLSGAADSLTRIDFVARGGLWVLAQVPLLLLVFILPVWSGSGELIPMHPLSVVGAVITAMSVLLAVWGLMSLGDALTPFPKPLSGASLHWQGAYRWMRHPIYSGVVLASLGWALWWLSLAGVFSVLVLAVFFDRKASHEEIGLCAQYKDYPDYARQVKKFIPGLY